MDLQQTRPTARWAADGVRVIEWPKLSFVAGRLGSGLPAHVDEGDLVSYGLLGLIGATSWVFWWAS